MTKDKEQSGERESVKWIKENAEDLYNFCSCLGTDYACSTCKLALESYIKVYEAAEKAGYLRALEEVQKFSDGYSDDDSILKWLLTNHIEKLKEQQQ